MTLLLGCASGLHAVTFSNTTSLAIADRASVSGAYGTASLYPSTINVSGVSGTIASVTVTITGYTSARPGDIDLLLVAPTGQKFVVMSDSGDNFNGGGAASNVTLTFSDAAGTSLPDSGPITSGTFLPRNVTSSTEVLPAPAPASPYNNPAPIGTATLTNVFGGLAANGLWSLYVVDDALGGGASTISGGWSINITPAVAAATTTTITSNNNPAFTTAPNSVTFTATVTGSSTVNAGTVTFTDLTTGITLASNVAVNASGVATATASFAAEGIHTIRALYNGTASFGTSNGTVAQEVNNRTTISGNEYANAGALTVNDSPGAGQFGSATPYPSKVFVSGLSGTITGLTVTLTNINEARPEDMDLLLVGPGGQSLILMSDNGGPNALTNVSLTFSDGAASVLPNDTQIVAGTFKPTNSGAGADTFPLPAPAPSAATTLSTFNGTSPNGEWRLYVVDDSLGGAAGAISGGWKLTITAGSAAATTTGLTSNNNPSFTAAPNNSVTFTASVSSNAVAVNVGTVTFTDTLTNTTIAANVAVVAGVAQTTTSFTTEGNHAVVATYNGTASFATSSATVAQVVNNHTSVAGNTFSNSLSVLTINDAPALGQFGTARPYPSRIFVTGLPRVAKVTVALTGLTEARPDDLDIILVSPAGTIVKLMSDAGTITNAVSNITLTFDDAAASFLPDEATLTTGTFKPSEYGAGADTFPAPAPQTAAAAMLATIIGENANGEWKLYVVDDAVGGGAGSMGSWSITITPLNAAPTLLDTAVTLNAVLEDAAAPSGVVGTLVSALVDLNPPAGGQDNVTDPDGNAAAGLAITGANTTSGVWFYSIDNGTNWLALGAVSNTSARVLAAEASTRVYFQPSANFNGTISTGLTFRAWDLSGGFANGTAAVNTSTNGGTSPFSTATDLAAITVTAVNDAPSFTKGANQSVYAGAGAQTLPGWAAAISPGPADESGQTVTFTVSNDANALFSAQPAVAPNGTLTYTPAAGANGTATVFVTAVDNGGTANGGVNTSPVQTFTINVRNLVVTTNADSGAGSLRQAIADAATFAGAQPITLPPALAGQTITLASEIAVNDAAGVTIDASVLATGMTISGGAGTNRLFSVAAGTTLSLTRLTLTNGHGGGATANGSGGAIYNAGTLALTDCALTVNSSTLLGGAITSEGAGTSVTALRCIFSSNTSGGSNGGGAIYANTSTQLACTDCTFTGNLSPTTAGAIHAINSATATLTRCTFSGNGGATTVDAGALRCTASGTLNVISCTLSGNTGTTNAGGILVNGGTATVRHCTLTGNNAPNGGGIQLNGGTLTVENSIVAGNTASTNGPDLYLVSGALTRLGASVIGKNTSVTVAYPAGVPNANGDYVGTAASPVNAFLAPLGNYGGLTQTIALLTASPARNHATVLAAITSDQRGFPIVGTPDIGAYEAGTLANFNAWAIETTGTALAFGIDTEKDGSVNGLEYALRRDPNVSDTGLAPTLTGPAGAHIFTFRYRAAARDLRYIVQRNIDLANIVGWLEIYRYDSSTGVVTQNGVTSNQNPATEIITVNDPAPGLRLFWRLRIEQVP